MRLLIVSTLTALALSWSAAPGLAKWDPLQKARRAAREGQQHLSAGDSLAAVDALLRAQALDPDDPEIGLGLAETLYETGQYKSSMGQYRSLADRSDPEREQKALYNAGNAAFAAQDLEQALGFYTQALASATGAPDPDLLYNLELAQQLLEQAQSQPDQQPGDENQEGDPSDEESDPQPGDESQPGEDSQEQEESEPDQGEDADQEQEQQPQPPEEEEESPSPADSTQAPPQSAAADSLLAMPEGMTPQEALRLLDALDHDEEELRRSIQRRLRGADTRSTKDW